MDRGGVRGSPVKLTTTTDSDDTIRVSMMVQTADGLPLLEGRRFGDLVSITVYCRQGLLTARDIPVADLRKWAENLTRKDGL
jgi:hypothetical protein